MIQIAKLKPWLITFLELFPLTAALVSMKKEFFIKSYFRRIGLAKLETRLASVSEGRVIAGPFEGMRYDRVSSGSVWAPKILGCYEEELHPIVEEIIRRRPDRIIDLGCAEGYYAVGFALRLPGTEVLAADVNPVARLRARKLAVRNKSKNVLIHGRLGKENLQSLSSEKCNVVVWCDIEGGEYDLINPNHVEALRRCMIVVEDHSISINKHQQDLIDCLKKSHEVNVFHQEKRVLNVQQHLKYKTDFTSSEWAMLLCEYRPAWQTWIVARPKIL
jgi:hypothetical protein